MTLPAGLLPKRRGGGPEGALWGRGGRGEALVVVPGPVFTLEAAREMGTKHRRRARKSRLGSRYLGGLLWDPREDFTKTGALY